MHSDFLKKKDYETSMADNLQTLGETLRGEWGSDIKQLDLGSVRESINLNKGDLSKLTERFSGLGDVVSTLRADQAKGLTEASGHRDLIDEQLSGLTGKDVELGKGIDTLKTNLADYRVKMAGQFGDIQKDYGDRFSQAALDTKSGLNKEAQARLSGLSKEAATREKSISQLGSSFGEQLGEQELALTRRIDKGKAEVDKHIKDIAATMNYRMLGNQAKGVSGRRSEAYESGATSTGTGQLSRSNREARVQTLNI